MKLVMLETIYLVVRGDGRAAARGPYGTRMEALAVARDFEEMDDTPWYVGTYDLRSTSAKDGRATPPSTPGGGGGNPPG